MKNESLNNSEENINNDNLKTNSINLPNNINIEASIPNEKVQSISALIKHGGEVTGYELSNGQKVSKDQGVQLAKNGEISGVTVAVSRKGEEYLRSLPDQNENNNLSSLPSINE